MLATALLFLLPNFFGFLVFTAGPVLSTLIMSFSNWNLQQTVPFRWSGLENYLSLLQDQEFWYYLVNTVYLMFGLPVAIFGSLFIAVLLNQKLRGITLYRTLYYLPTITSGVALMILWKALYNPDYGPINFCINFILENTGINGLVESWTGDRISAPAWLQATPNLIGLDVERLSLTWSQWGLGARDAIVLMGIWIAIGGNNMLLYLAALTQVPKDLYEAAAIDGAGAGATFRYITWPQLAPTTFFIVVISFIGGLQGGFEQARVMTEGGPGGTTTTLTYYIYIKAFEEFQVGYAAAVSWILFLMIFAVTLVNWKFGAKELNY